MENQVNNDTPWLLLAFPYKSTTEIHEFRTTINQLRVSWNTVTKVKNKHRDKHQLLASQDTIAKEQE